MENLAQEDAALVDEIRRLMFVFEDIAKLGDRDIQTLLKNVESPSMGNGPKGASDELKDKILKNMSKRAADLLERGNGVFGSGAALERGTDATANRGRYPALEDMGEITTHAAEEEVQFIQ